MLLINVMQVAQGAQFVWNMQIIFNSMYVIPVAACPSKDAKYKLQAVVNTYNAGC